MPIPGYRAAVLDENGELCAPGVVGRLAVKDPTGCRYLADERQKEYVANGWNLTGDAYLTDEDGYFHYQSRTDDMIISTGYNIAGPEFESVLLLHPDVADCAAVGWPDEKRGEIVKAYLVPRQGRAADAALARKLQRYLLRAPPAKGGASSPPWPCQDELRRGQRHRLCQLRTMRYRARMRLVSNKTLREFALRHRACGGPLRSTSIHRRSMCERY